MKKMFFCIIATATLLFAGCGLYEPSSQAVNDETTHEPITDDYGQGEETGTKTPDWNAEETTAFEDDNASKEISELPEGVNEKGDKYAYKINGSILDFDSVAGPYIIVNLDEMRVLDSTSTGTKIVDYSKEGDKIIITFYSDENPENMTYLIDISITAFGTLPVS